MKKYIYLVFFLTIYNLGLSQVYKGSSKQIEQILASVEKFSSYVVSSNYEMIGQSYTEDGKIFPNNRDIITGREAIIKYWELPEGVSIVHHKITPSEIRVKGKEAYDYGYYEGRTRSADGKESSWKGKYVIVWKKVGKDWKMYLDIWNRIAN